MSRFPRCSLTPLMTRGLLGMWLKPDLTWVVSGTGWHFVMATQLCCQWGVKRPVKSVTSDLNKSTWGQEEAFWFCLSTGFMKLNLLTLVCLLVDSHVNISSKTSRVFQGPAFSCSRLPRASRSVFCSTAWSGASPPPGARLDCGPFCQVSTRGV